MNINNRYTSNNDDNEPQALPEDIFGEVSEHDRAQRQLDAVALIQEVQDLTNALRKLTALNFVFPTWKAINEVKHMADMLTSARDYLVEIVQQKRPHIRNQFPEN
jgi:hypothetical protein